MTPQASGDFLHRLEPTVQDAGAPKVEQLSCPCRGRVFKEPLELFAEQVGRNTLEILLH
jgi:hypothetical protein